MEILREEMILFFLVKRATEGSYFEALKTNHFDKKLQWIAGLASENLLKI